MTISKELADKIQQAQALLSHAISSNDIVDYLEYVTDRVIKQKTSVRPHFQEKATATVEVKPFSARTRKTVINKDKCCRYKDPSTGKQCGGRWFLQIDHKQSRWANGQSTIENAQLFCAQHNKMKYRQEAGLKYLSQ
ncbi:hypothetical protein [Bdellovibrio sp. BCCA]|uniref:hypothetical protein n=1 Tax=Bdellovibrio sp. BCCA TaxID=3136281 RepID=UPI0030F2BFA1